METIKIVKNKSNLRMKYVKCSLVLLYKGSRRSYHSTSFSCSTGPVVVVIFIWNRSFEKLGLILLTLCASNITNRGVATSMIARLKQPRNDFSAAPQLFKCKTTIKSWHGFLCRAINEVATPR